MDKTITDAQSARKELEDALRSLSERGIDSPGLRQQLEQAMEAVWEVEMSHSSDPAATALPSETARPERRAYPREAVGGPGTIILADATRLDVTVVNNSRTGIMLELSDNVELPQRFNLLFSNILEPCDLVWQNGIFVGAKYAN